MNFFMGVVSAAMYPSRWHHFNALEKFVIQVELRALLELRPYKHAALNRRLNA